MMRNCKWYRVSFLDPPNDGPRGYHLAYDPDEHWPVSYPNTGSVVLACGCISDEQYREYHKDRLRYYVSLYKHLVRLASFRGANMLCEKGQQVALLASMRGEL